MAPSVAKSLVKTDADRGQGLGTGFLLNSIFKAGMMVLIDSRALGEDRSIVVKRGAIDERRERS